MNHRTHPHLVATALILATGVGAALSGCSSTSTAGTTTSSGTAASSTSTPRTNPPATNDPSNTPGVPPNTSGAPSSTSTASPGTRAERCTATQLTGRLGQQAHKPAGAGSGPTDPQYLTIVLTNTTSTPCTIQGWPGVSYVGGNNGTQIGAPAQTTTNVPRPTVTLRQGGSAHAPITVFNAATYQASACKPVLADGLRIYPPGSRTSLYIKGGALDNGYVCSDVKFGLLNTLAFLPGS